MNDRDYDFAQVMHTRFLGVSDSLHKLADQFDQDSLNLDAARLNAMSVELQRIGWHSLFVSTTIDTMVRVLPSNVISPYWNDQTAISRRVDGLHVALKYLAQSIHSMKTGRADHEGDKQAINEALRQLATKLQEVAFECQRP